MAKQHPHAQVSEVERDMQKLEVGLKNLEAQYNMYFSGRLPKPPWETRSAVEALVKRYDRGFIQNYGDRFRFQTLQARFQAFIDLWDKGLRAREEGRPGPFAQQGAKREEPKKIENRILRVAAFSDPLREQDKLQELYESLAEARHEVGLEPVPYHKFAELVKNQVNKLNEDGDTEVAFRVAIKEGKVSFTARAMRGIGE
ncbi:MAG TPA: MXAN_5187 C-terminal domain-containing protein [Vicinamibacterales bacterium]|nr:MXAN_5187 C-terminal domain-containing protein [Vicinamibacterales bacterium]